MTPSRTIFPNDSRSDTICTDCRHYRPACHPPVSPASVAGFGWPVTDRTHRFHVEFVGILAYRDNVPAASKRAGDGRVELQQRQPTCFWSLFQRFSTFLGLAETVLARWPTPFAHAIVGTQLAVAGRHADAIAELRRAVPEYTLARYHLGGELFNQGAVDEATVQLQEFVRLEPSLAEAVPARTMIGRAQMLSSKFPEAIEQFRQVLTMTRQGDEAHTTALGFLADALFGAHRFDEAAAEYRAYVVSRPRDAGAFINLGISSTQIGKPVEAAAAFQRAIQLEPSNASARRNLAIVQEALHSRP